MILIEVRERRAAVRTLVELLIVVSLLRHRGGSGLWLSVLLATIPLPIVPLTVVVLLVVVLLIVVPQPVVLLVVVEAIERIEVEAVGHLPCADSARGSRGKLGKLTHLIAPSRRSQVGKIDHRRVGCFGLRQE